LDALPEIERVGPSLMPFLRHKSNDRWWRLSLGCLWLPAIVVLLQIEEWLHIPQTMGWISLGALALLFIAIAVVADKKLR
jgi:hypothetical protein